MNDDLARRILGYAANLQKNQEIVPYAEGGFMNPRGPAEAAWNVVAAVPNTVFGKGLMAPTSDVTRMALATLQGKNLPTYNSLSSGPVGLAYNLRGIQPEDKEKNLVRALIPIVTAAAMARKLSPKSATNYARDRLGRFAGRNAEYVRGPDRL